MKIKIKIQVIDEDEDLILFENNYRTIKSFKTFDPEKEIEAIINGLKIKLGNKDEKEDNK